MSKHFIALSFGFLLTSAIHSPTVRAEDIPSSPPNATDNPEAQPASTTPSGNRVLIDTSLGVFSDYVFRGLERYPGLSFQPSATAGYSLSDDSVISANLWLHLPLDGEVEGHEFSELDGTLIYDLTLGPLLISAGHVWYTFPDDDAREDDSAEWYGSFAFDTALNPRIATYYDYRRYDSLFTEFSVSHHLEYSSLGGINVTPFFALGFSAGHDPRYTRDGLEYLTWGAYTEGSVGNLGIVPSIHFTSAIDEKTTNDLWAGVAFNYSF